MAFTIFVSPQGPKFSCKKDQTLLEAALDNNLNISYGCRAGLCTSCKGKVLEGKVSGNFKSLNEDTDSQNVLFCQAKPLTDLTIGIIKRDSDKSIEIVKLPARIVKVDNEENHQTITIKTPANTEFSAAVGQRVLVSAVDHGLLFHIEAIEDDQRVTLTSNADPDLFASITKNSLIHIEGPFD